jgi:hypothetical protein
MIQLHLDTRRHYSAPVLLPLAFRLPRDDSSPRSVKNSPSIRCLHSIRTRMTYFQPEANVNLPFSFNCVDSHHDLRRAIKRPSADTILKIWQCGCGGLFKPPLIVVVAGIAHAHSFSRPRQAVSRMSIHAVHCLWLNDILGPCTASH